MTRISLRHSPCMRPLTAALVLGLGGGLASAVATATTLPVTSCADSGTGSLRQVVHDATSLDTVDLSKLTCSQISLTTGAIAVGQDSLSIIGPGAEKLTLYHLSDLPTLSSNVISHTGTGTLEIDDLTIAHGAPVDGTCFLGATVSGGCICSTGSVTLKRSQVMNCKATGSTLHAYGGGIFAARDISLDHSTISGNQLLGPHSATHAGGVAYQAGGGVFALGNIDVRYSQVIDNFASGSGGGISAGFSSGNSQLYITHSLVSGNTIYSTYGIFHGAGIFSNAVSARIDNSIISNNRTGGNCTSAFGSGGGIFSAAATLRFSQSTISGNHACVGYAAIYAITGQESSTVLITDSTISGNTSSYNFSAINKVGVLTILNSTIAFNQPSGLGGSLQATELESSIIADGVPAAGTLTGANNLIPFFSGQGLLATITACPMLGPLADNGGPTPTHALLHTSPAIDNGTNTLGLANDQRGAGFMRTYGVGTDIGAFEWQGGIDDPIFHNQFEILDRCGE
jgi:hypothetical protein